MQLVIDPQFAGLDGLGDGGNARLGTFDKRFDTLRIICAYNSIRERA
jgi:hypothetical protein